MPGCPHPACSTATRGTTTRSRCCSPRRTPRSTCARSPPWPATARSTVSPTTRARSARWRGSATSRSRRARRARRGATLEVAADIHGESALDGAVLPDPDVALDPRPGARLIAETLARGPGAADAVRDRPADQRRRGARDAPTSPAIREIVWMGGSTERGNRTPYAEFNAWADPEAAAAVLASGVPFTMVGLNLTHQALATGAGDRADRRARDPAVGRRRRLARRSSPPRTARCSASRRRRSTTRARSRSSRRRASSRPSTRSSRSRPRAAGRAARPSSTSTAGSGRRRTPAWRPSSTSRASGTSWSTRSRSWGADVLPRGLAPLLVFVASGAVLVLEILGVRLLAPYVGLTLETYTTIIGVVLAGIALGAAAGGRAADRVDRAAAARAAAGRRRAARAADRPARAAARRGVRGRGHGERAGARAVRAAAPGDRAQRGHAGRRQARSSATSPRAARSSAGCPAWATAGALAGTFSTGFVLVPLLPVRVTVIGLGALLVLAGLAVGLALPRVPGRHGARRRAAPRRCSPRSRRCRARAARPRASTTARTSWPTPTARRAACSCSTTCATPTSTSSDPRHLEFAYTRWMGDAIDAMRPPGEPLDAVFVGGGGFTLPRYLAATRPGSHSRVLEVDRQLVDLARERLGLRTGPRPAGRRRRRARHAARRAGRLRRRRRRRRVRRPLGPLAPGDARVRRATSAASCAPTGSTCST